MKLQELAEGKKVKKKKQRASLIQNDDDSLWEDMSSGDYEYGEK